MNTSFTISVEFPDGTEKEIEFEAEFSKGGIGAYEFWGQKCYDAGNWELDSVTYNEDDFTIEECDYIEKEILDSDAVDVACWDSLNKD